MQAQGYADAVAEGTVTLEVALAAHLQSNHYPPLPTSLVAACIAALEAAADDDWGRLVALPDGLQLRDRDAVPADELIEAAHLSAFLQADED